MAATRHRLPLRTWSTGSAGLCWMPHYDDSSWPPCAATPPKSCKWPRPNAGANGNRTPDLLDANETTWTFEVVDCVGRVNNSQVNRLEALTGRELRRSYCGRTADAGGRGWNLAPRERTLAERGTRCGDQTGTPHPFRPDVKGSLLAQVSAQLASSKQYCAKGNRVESSAAQIVEEPRVTNVKARCGQCS